MADVNEIKEVLRRKLRPGKIITEQQLTEAARRLGELKQAQASDLVKIASDVTEDAGTFSATDMSDINGELDKFNKKK